MSRTAPQALSLGALVLLGVVAGFLVATTAQGESFTTVGTATSPQAAFALELDGDRLRFTLDAQPEAQAPAATFLLYDPEDGLFGTFTVSGDEHVDTVTRAQGTWVVVVAEARAANLVVQVADEGSGQAQSPTLTPLAVDRREETVARQAQGPLDSQLGLRVDQRPHLALLETRATARGLTAMVESPLGPVYTLDHQRTNTTGDGPALVQGTRELAPGNLATGPYSVTAQAETFGGSLSLVLLTYDRSSLDPHRVAPIPTNATLEELLGRGAVVAEMSQGQAVAVDSQGAEHLLLVAPAHTVARLLVYDPGDRALGLFQVGQDPDRTFNFGEEDAETNATAQGLHVPMVRGGEHVIVVDRIYGQTETVHVVLPGTHEATSGRELAIAQRTIALSESEPGTTSRDEATVALDGGLVAVRVEEDSPSDLSEHVVVTGPRGVVFEHAVQAGVAGVSAGEEARRVPAHFSGGTFTIQWTSSVPLDWTNVVLSSYHR